MSHPPGAPGRASAILTFLIADVRGYTQYTRSAGDEAAARLAATFAEIVREGVEAFGGEVIELRGDEVLAVFASARGGLRAAAALQVVFATETTIRPAVPLAVGIGLDAGEAVPVEDGYRGAALNLAARLCSVAQAGEVIASEGVIHLAGATDGLVIRPRGGLELKGLGQPIDAFEISAVDTGRPATVPAVPPGAIPPELDAFGPVVGRDREIRALRWAWRSARTRSIVRVVRGPAGVGKTRLAAEIAALAQQDGATVRYATAAADPGSVARAADQANTAGDPTLLVLDDLDAAASTAEVIDSVVAGSGPPGLVLLISTDSSVAPVAVTRALARATSADPIVIGPLDEAAIAEILAASGSAPPDPRRVHAIAQSSHGLPGQVLLLAAEWVQEEAVRRLGGATSRAAAGRRDLRRFESEVAANLVDLQLARERTLTLRSEDEGRSRDERCPFMGLASFDVTDADLFFGRERLVAEMVGRLAGAAFLGIVGPSGSGKSSAMRAGLLPTLETGALPGSERWIRVLLRPGSEPQRELDRAAYAALPDEVRRALPSGTDAVRGALATLPTDTTLLISVDQFEEIFTLVPGATERAAFVGTLEDAAASGRAIVILAIRADFYGRCAEDERLAALLAANHLLVGPMNADEYRRAIEGPARRAGLRVEPALADELVADVLDQPGGLPLLSTALVELWERRDGRTLRHAAYAATGGVRGAVSRLAEAAYGRLDDVQERIARSIFLRLVAGQDDAVARRRVPLAELDADTNDDVRQTLAVLTDARLLTVGEGNVEVAHEALLREWPRLAGWIEEDREGRRLRARLGDASREWASTGRDSSELYRGARLAAALDWTATHTLELNDLEREFVTESRAATEREAGRQARTNRRLRGLLAGTAIGLVVAIAAGSLAVLQKQAADRASNDANAQRIAADEQRSVAQHAATAADAQRLGALALATKDLDLSLLLARQGVALDDSPVTRADLLADLARSPAAIRIGRPLPGRLLNVYASDDGSTVVVDNNGGQFAVIDGTTGATRYTKGSNDHPLFAGATSDRNVWVETDSGPPAPPSIEILDGRTGAELRSFVSPLANLASFGISPDLGLFAAVPVDGRSIVVLDTRTRARVRQLSAPAGTSIVNINGLVGGHWLVSSIDGPLPSAPPFGKRGTLDWWGPSGTRPLISIPVPDVTTGYAVSPDGEELSVDNDPEPGRETVVDLTTGAQRVMQGQHSARVQGSGFSPDGSTLVTGGDDRLALVWNVKTGDLKETLAGHNGRVFGPAVAAPGGRLTAWTVSLDGSMMTWDLSGTRRLGQPFAGGSGDESGAPIFDPAASVATSPDGRWLLVGEDSGAAVIDITTHAIVHQINHAATDFPTVVAWSPDGKRVALTGDGADGVELYDTATWQTVSGPLRGPAADRAQGPNEPPVGSVKGREPNAARAVSFSTDSARVIAGFDDGTIWTWDAETGAPVGQPIQIGAAAYAIALRADGTLAVAVNVLGTSGSPKRGEALIFDPGATISRLTVDVDGSYGHADAVAFSPDGRTLATGGGTGDVRFWDVASGAEIGRRVSANAGWVLTLAWTADGKEVVTGGTDGTVRLIDVATETEAGTLPGLNYTGVNNIAVDAALMRDGRHVVGTYENGQALEWSIAPSDWAAAACAIAGRTLTQDEWSRYLPNEPYGPACGQ